MNRKEAIQKAYELAVADNKTHMVTRNWSGDGYCVDDPMEVELSKTGNGNDALFVGKTNMREAIYDNHFGWQNRTLPLPKYITDTMTA